MSQRGTLLIILVQNRHYFKRRSLGWHIVALVTWPSILLHEQTGSFYYFLFFKFTVEASCFSTGCAARLKSHKMMLLFCMQHFWAVRKTEIRDKHVYPTRYMFTLNLRPKEVMVFFFSSAPIYSTFYDSCNERILYTRNRNMSCKYFKKATHLYSC